MESRNLCKALIICLPAKATGRSEMHLMNPALQPLSTSRMGPQETSTQKKIGTRILVMTEKGPTCTAR